MAAEIATFKDSVFFPPGIVTLLVIKEIISSLIPLPSLPKIK